MKQRFRSDMPVSAYVSKSCTQWISFGRSSHADSFASITRLSLEALNRRYEIIEVRCNVWRNGRISCKLMRFPGGDLGKRLAAQYLLDKGYLPYE